MFSKNESRTRISQLLNENQNVLRNGPRREKTSLRGGGGGGRGCDQQRRRPACASAQSDQRLFIPFLESIIYKHAIGEITTF